MVVLSNDFQISYATKQLVVKCLQQDTGRKTKPGPEWLEVAKQTANAIHSSREYFMLELYTINAYHLMPCSTDLLDDDDRQAVSIWENKHESSTSR